MDLENINPTPAAADAPIPSRARIALAGGVLALAALAVYANSLACPFVFDDQPTIVSNPSIRHLWPLRDVLWPPASGGGAAGRPLLNLALALNYAAGGLDVRGYHAVDVLLHALVALVLFGVVRRTLEFGSCRSLLAGESAGESRASSLLHSEALLPAFTAALLWAVHPLLTESVVLAVNRAELLAALFYLLTLYGFIRGVASRTTSGRWLAVSVGACLLGMASKEWMVSAPLLVLLYDRTFVAGSFGPHGNGGGDGMGCSRAPGSRSAW